MVKIISPVTQRQVEAEQIDFEGKDEPWSTYELTDGRTLKVRVILTGVLRIEGEYDQSGNLIYVVSSQTVIQANAAKKICFFQAEGGIRDLTVTGVQTCALPI